jgi:DNA-binding MarR family transcriptional regulator
VLRRAPDESDRRVVRLEPTADALAARERRERSWGAHLADVLDGLSTADRAALTAAIPALQHLAGALSAEA